MCPFKALFWPDILPIWSDIVHVLWGNVQSNVCYEIKTNHDSVKFVIFPMCFRKQTWSKNENPMTKAKSYSCLIMMAKYNVNWTDHVQKPTVTSSTVNAF